MARYVVLSFEDNDVAEEFVKNGKDFLDATYDNFWGGVKLIALIAQPTQFCETRGIGCVSGRIKPWSRGKKFGWWICNGCYKPCPPQGDTDKECAESLMRHTISQGVNLLEEAANRMANVFDTGWGALGRDRD